jgi:hypothetical protein
VNLEHRLILEERKRKMFLIASKPLCMRDSKSNQDWRGHKKQARLEGEFEDTAGSVL